MLRLVTQALPGEGGCAFGGLGFTMPFSWAGTGSQLLVSLRINMEEHSDIHCQVVLQKVKPSCACSGPTGGLMAVLCGPMNKQQQLDRKVSSESLSLCSNQKEGKDCSKHPHQESPEGQACRSSQRSLYSWMSLWLPLPVHLPRHFYSTA